MLRRVRVPARRFADYQPFVPRSLYGEVERLARGLYDALLRPVADPGVLPLLVFTGTAAAAIPSLGFLTGIRTKSMLKIFHIPLDLSVQTVLRRRGLLKRRELHRHIHYFTKETALETLKDTGYTPLDYVFTAHGVDCGHATGQKIARLPRKMCFAIHQDLTVRILGGYSLLALAR